MAPDNRVQVLMNTKTWGSTATNLRRPTDGPWDADEARLTQTHEVTPVDLGVPTIAAISTDPGYTGGGLWGMYGDTTTVANPYGSQAGEAWANGFTGSTSTIVGVIDTGIDYTHPDLFANVWLNQREIPYTLRVSLSDIDTDGLITLRDLNDAANADWVRDGNANGFIDARDLLTDSRWENGVDDNADGFVDDLIGWDFVNNDNDPYDDNGHGTHVSGTIGAMGGNGVGVAGVNWSIQIVPLKFLSASGSGTLSNAIRAVDYFTNLAAHASAGGKLRRDQQFLGRRRLCAAVVGRDRPRRPPGRAVRRGSGQFRQQQRHDRQLSGELLHHRGGWV